MTVIDSDYYGSKIAVAKDNGDVTIYATDKDGNTGDQLATYSNAHVKPTAIHWGHPRYSPSLLSAGLDGVLNVYSYDSHSDAWGECEKLVVLDDGIIDAKFSPQRFGLNVACATHNSLVFLSYDEIQQAWIKFSEEKVSRLGNKAIAWNSEEPRLVTAGNGGVAAIYFVNFDTKSITLSQELTYKDLSFKSVIWSGIYILLQAETGELVCWEEEQPSEGAESNWKLRKIPDGFSPTDTILSFNALGKVVVVGNDDSMKHLLIGKDDIYLMAA